MSKLTTLSSENTIFQWKTNTKNDKFSLKNVYKKSFFYVFGSYLFWCHFGLDFSTFWVPQIVNLGHFSVPKPCLRKTPPPFYKVYASKCAPDPQNVPKRSPKCPKMSPKCPQEASKSLKFGDLEPSSLPCYVKVPQKRQMKHSDFMKIPPTHWAKWFKVILFI